MSREAGGCVIREATVAELGAVMSAVRDGWRQYADGMDEEGEREMERSLMACAPIMAEARVFVADRGGEILGCVGYCAPGRSDGIIFPTEWASIRLLTVVPSARGLGLGRLLMERCVAAATDDHAEILGLHTDERMAVARGLYARMGFVWESDLPSRQGVPRWRFVLRLADRLAAT